MKPLFFDKGTLKLVDQRLLPNKYRLVTIKGYKSCAKAIKNMIVRGAPAIGITAAYGIAIGAENIRTKNKNKFFTKLNNISTILKNTRPTAVNLFWAINRMNNVALINKDKELDIIKQLLIDEAIRIEFEDFEINKRLGFNGNSLIKNESTILTHCNAGSLATSDYGTALGVVRAAHHSGKKINVIATETRPFLQGARLTTYELKKDGIPVSLICDNMAGFMMQQDKIDCVIVGADRIVANGDTANKIGTYSLAVLAKNHNIPFYIAAPFSTIDINTKNGSQINIEHRNPKEVLIFNKKRIAAKGVTAYNPSFDVTPSELITAIITEMGVIYPPFEENIMNIINTAFKAPIVEEISIKTTQQNTNGQQDINTQNTINSENNQIINAIDKSDNIEQNADNKTIETIESSPVNEHDNPIICEEALNHSTDNDINNNSTTN